VQLVGQTRGEELGVHRSAALDHQPADAPGRQVRGDHPQVDRVAAVHHGRHRTEPAAGRGHRRRRAVDQLVDVAESEEGRLRIEVAAARDGHLDRGRPGAARDPRGTPVGRADQQSRIVLPDRGGTDQDRVAPGPDLVDPVEVGVVGEQQAGRRGVVQVSVDGHATAQQDVGPLNHR